ncbi:EAL domain-containing protein (putative c-di-GMP-specific phosphodiesterase class I) [Crenobacter luteus]|uniref:bifunctional diguanylate cyclase/phosphodiesterase n=1 Tax=Crenobacter luteus TaxID=1452487 RepID=UPI0010526261|nr:EAL domain-containing protein [Crenobacter luteus]TCP15117.1 EAL domain-containing protein (putative c-di-GMP-specific phosphodiesterase class I) [Crenobacter luteus]
MSSSPPLSPLRRLTQPAWLLALLMLTGVAGCWLMIEFASREADARHRRFSVAQMAHEIDMQRDALNMRLADYTVWDAMYDATAQPAVDAAWLRDNLTGSIQRNFDIGLAQLLDADGTPLYTVRDGRIASGADRRELFTAAQWQSLRRSVDRYDPYGSQGYPSTLVRVDGPGGRPRFLLTALQRVVPESRTPERAAPRRYLLFAREFGPALLEQLARNRAVHAMRLGFAAPEPPRVGLRLNDVNGEAIGWLSWSEATPGGGLRAELLPRFAGLFLLLAALAAFILRRARRSERAHRAVTERLARQGATLRELVVGRREDADALPDYLDALVAAIASTLDAPRVSLWRFSADKRELECLAGVDQGPAPLRGARLTVAEHPDYFAALGRSRVLVASQARRDPRLVSLRGYLFPHRIESMLDAAIVLGGREYGVICVEDRRAGRVWHQDEVNFVSSAADVVALVLESGARLEAEGELYRQFYYDRFTGLPNRARLMMQLDEQIAQGEGRPFGCFLIAIEGLASINGLYGREHGDQLIAALGERLERFLQTGEMLARSADNRFCLTLAGRDAAAIERRADELTRAATLPARGEGPATPQPVLRGGLAIYPYDLHDARAARKLVDHAELALQTARAQPGNGWRRFDLSMSDEWLRRQQLAHDLRGAAEAGQLALHYQPYLTPDGRRVAGAEALLRWQHPERGMIPPADFIPLAEETGLIVDVGEWALATACAQAARWRAAGHGGFTVSVNVSLVQLENESFAARTAALLDAHRLPAEALELEVTESLALSHSATIDRNVAALRAQGIRLAIDDFGTGYASFSYLRRFPAEKLKIDRDFLLHVPDNAQAASLVRMIVAMGHALGAKVTGEGVENARQLAFLAEVGCDFAQGFFLSRPLDADAMDRFLDAPWAARAGDETLRQ